MHAQLQALINVQMYFSVQHSTRSIQNHIEHGLMIFGVAGFQHLLLPNIGYILEIMEFILTTSSA